MASALLLPLDAAAYKEVEVTKGGTIKGKVTFVGSEAEANEHNKTYTITKDTDVCGAGTREVNYVKVKKYRRGKLRLSDVVVYLDKVRVKVKKKYKYKPVKKGKAWPEDDKNTTIDQKSCAFLPFFTVMANKGELTATNSDPVAHNIHTYAIIGKAKKTKINVSQAEQGSSVTKKVKLSKKSHGMKVECDQHDFMHSFVFVAKNPYYAVVSENGTYKIKDIPKGKYKVKAWHGYLKAPKTKTVRVKAGKTKRVNFYFKNKKK
ncbi:MAG: hypothetical protein DRR08_08295 [Candidatus Parabeggiatoa sp. nov. 2]|nr:MAG: hypothetical protein DRR08_08295 [Gammaproteobacteria bacterium]HEC85788.1 carboxypeptidase regulatory-like domain-containing protein [Thioploca sp.]